MDRFGKIEHRKILEILKDGKNRQFRVTPACLD